MEVKPNIVSPNSISDMVAELVYPLLKKNIQTIYATLLLICIFGEPK